MSARDMARILGRRGGRRRAERLPAEERRRIAALGGRARRQSLVLAQRIEDTLRYAGAAAALRPPTKVTRSAIARGRLPGLYPRNR